MAVYIALILAFEQRAYDAWIILWQYSAGVD